MTHYFVCKEGMSFLGLKYTLFPRVLLVFVIYLTSQRIFVQCSGYRQNNRVGFFPKNLHIVFLHLSVQMCTGDTLLGVPGQVSCSGCSKSTRSFFTL